MEDTGSTCPCSVCGTLTSMTGIKLCNGCWEFASRFDDVVSRASRRQLWAWKRLMAVELERRARQAEAAQ